MPVGATVNSALARQARAKKNVVLVDLQLTSTQQKMEEAKTEMAAADKSVNEARQLAVQDTSMFADGSSATLPDPAARPRCKRPRSPSECDRGADKHEGEATRTASSSTNDANSDTRVRAVQGAANHTGKQFFERRCGKPKPLPCSRARGPHLAKRKSPTTLEVMEGLEERPRREVERDKRGIAE